MRKFRCQSRGVVFTDVGDEVEVRCSYFWTLKGDEHDKVIVLDPEPPKHEHQAEIIFARGGFPYLLKWSDD